MSKDIRPSYYVGHSGQQITDVIRDFDLDFFSGNVLKYMARAGRKSNYSLEDLLKARTYLNMLIEQAEKDNVVAEEISEPSKVEVTNIYVNGQPVRPEDFEASRINYYQRVLEPLAADIGKMYHDSYSYQSTGENID